MLSNYLKTAIRFLLRNRTFSLINILGLAAGTLCCLYIVLFVTDQYSYDKQHERVADLYRVTTKGSISGGQSFLSAYCSPPIAPAIKKDFAPVQQYTRVLDMNGFGAKQHLLRYKDKSFYETDCAYADSTFFDLFRFHFVEGNPHTALYNPYTAVLLRPVAERLFGGESAIGKVVNIDNAMGKHDFTITGVIDESLGKSHLHYNIIISMNSGGLGEFVRKSNAWAAQSMTSSYIRLVPGTEAATIQNQLPAFMNRYGADQLKSLGMTKELLLQPVRTIHTTAGYNHDDRSVSSGFLMLLLIIAVLIQIIACINFMNLSTARAARRAKEVGVRKVIGAGRGNLIRQFLGESFLLCLLAVVIAVPLLLAVLPWLNRITASDVHMQLLLDYRIGLLLLGLVLVTGFIAGSYPAFYLSAFQASRVIKGNFTNRVSAAGIRRGLVVFQFVLSIVLISGIVVIYSQLNYIKNKDLGFDKEQKLVFTFSTDEAKTQVPAFAEGLRGLAGVRTVSMANNHLGWSVPNSWVYYRGGQTSSAGQDIKQIYCDENFAKANGIKLLSGRDFSPTDSAKVLLNETAVRQLGMTVENAVGTRIFPQQDPGEKPAWVEVAGVIKDFNFSSLHENLGCFMLRFADAGVKQFMDIRSDLTVSASTNDYKTLIGQIQTLWNRKFSGAPFEYAFMDDIVQRQYATEEVLSRIINSFTLIAIAISCLGLFGLAAFSAEQRSKEVAIRKVLGASVGGLAGLLSKEFLKLVGIALVIAVPIGWWMMQRWLEGFAYRVTLSWWMFGLAGMLAVMIALVTVSFQAIRAAIANPVVALKNGE